MNQIATSCGLTTEGAFTPRINPLPPSRAKPVAKSAVVRLQEPDVDGEPLSGGGYTSGFQRTFSFFVMTRPLRRTQHAKRRKQALCLSGNSAGVGNPNIGASPEIKVYAIKQAKQVRMRQCLGYNASLPYARTPLPLPIYYVRRNYFAYVRAYLAHKMAVRIYSRP